jgi:peroxiredoxin
MNKIIGLIVAGIILTACGKEQTGYEVTVKLANKTEGLAYLMKVENNALVAFDSAEFNNGYVFKGSVEKPMWAVFNIKGTNDRTDFFISNDAINISANEANPMKIDFEGTKVNDIYETYLDSANNFSILNSKLYAEYQEANKSGDKEAEEQIRAKMEMIYEAEQTFSENFAINNLENLVGLHIIRRKLVYNMGYDDLKAAMDKIPASNQDNDYYSYLVGHLAKLEKTKVGNIAPDFTMKDTAGNDVSLKDFRGNYTLIDFWAAWCGPCRRANPHVVEIYNEFNAKGFQVLGVSFDQDKEKWLQAIKDDQLPWTQVSDLQGWNNAAGKLYGVNSIPHTVLIDPEGKIVMNKFTHEELKEKLKEIYE